MVTDHVKHKLMGPSGPNSIWAPGSAAGEKDQMEPVMEALIMVPGTMAEQLFPSLDELSGVTSGWRTVITRDDWVAARDS